MVDLRKSLATPPAAAWGCWLLAAGCVAGLALPHYRFESDE
jgi:hypothetical protein